jgi:hypothetical protein
MLRRHYPGVTVRAYGGGDSRIIDWESSQQRPTRPARVALRNKVEEEEPGPSSTEATEDFQEQNEDEGLEALGRYAREQNLAASLDAMREAELLADRAQVENDFESLYCNDLSDIPDNIFNIFSASLGDIFHAIGRVKISVQHDHKKAYKVSLMKAMLEWEPEHLKEVKRLLLRAGWSEDEFDSMLYYRPSFSDGLRCLHARCISVSEQCL